MQATRRWITGLVGAATLCMTLGVQAQSGQTLKIGVIGPFTGPSSDFGIPMLQGVQLAVEEINAVGGYMGRPYELVVKDDQGNPDVGLKGSQELVAGPPNKAMERTGMDKVPGPRAKRAQPDVGWRAAAHRQR